jgi:5-methylcytosine-specific restriction endonuclease McrBC regulatory subunit McrC
MRPQSDGLWTLEELCRSMWRNDKKGFMELARNNSYQLFVYQFQREDAETALLNGPRHLAVARS